MVRDYHSPSVSGCSGRSPCVRHAYIVSAEIFLPSSPDTFSRCSSRRSSLHAPRISLVETKGNDILPPPSPRDQFAIDLGSAFKSPALRSTLSHRGDRAYLSASRLVYSAEYGEFKRSYPSIQRGGEEKRVSGFPRRRRRNRKIYPRPRREFHPTVHGGLFSPADFLDSFSRSSLSAVFVVPYDSTQMYG